MSNGNPQVRKPESDDPMVISVVLFTTPVNLGGHGIDDWSLRNVGHNQYHGKSRIEPWQDKGIRLVYKAGDHYEEHEVPWANIRDVVKVPLSRLDDNTREYLERMKKEIVR